MEVCLPAVDTTAAAGNAFIIDGSLQTNPKKALNANFVKGRQKVRRFTNRISKAKAKL